MLRYLVPLAIGCVCLAVGGQLLLESIRDPTFETERRRGRMLDATLSNIRIFQDDVNLVIAEVVNGLSLREAADRIEQSAEKHCPTYLDHVMPKTKLLTVPERIALNIVLDLRKQNLAFPGSLLNRLEAELAEDFPAAAEESPPGTTSFR